MDTLIITLPINTWDDLRNWVLEPGRTSVDLLPLWKYMGGGDTMPMDAQQKIADAIEAKVPDLSTPTQWKPGMKATSSGGQEGSRTRSPKPQPAPTGKQPVDMQELGAIVQKAVEGATKPLVERIEGLEARNIVVDLPDFAEGDMVTYAFRGRTQTGKIVQGPNEDGYYSVRVGQKSHRVLGDQLESAVSQPSGAVEAEEEDGDAGKKSSYNKWTDLNWWITGKERQGSSRKAS